MSEDARVTYAGIYTVEAWLDKDGENRFQQLWFAVNPDPAEGELVFAAHDVVRDRLDVHRIVRGLPSEANVALDSGSSELGPLLLLATLFFLISEAVVARFVSARRL